MLILVAVTRNPSVPQGVGPGSSPGGPLDVGGPGADGAIPVDGRDAILAGGVTTLPVPDGWRTVTKGDSRRGPGGHPEVAVITNGSGVTVSAYVLDPSSVEPAELGAAADADARKWIRDGEGGSVEGGQPLQPSGTISGAISVRYHVTLAGRALDGELIRAARQDGFVVLVFVDAPQGGLDGSNPQWGPIRAAVLRVFAR